MTEAPAPCRCKFTLDIQKRPRWLSRWRGHTYRYAYECLDCGAKTPWCDTSEAAWNRVAKEAGHE